MPSVSGSDKYFSLVANRECGDCMECCQYLHINTSALKKPADVLCQNYIDGQGCQIYATRPSVCRIWHCLWRRDAKLPDELRPDKSKVIFSLNISYEPRHIFENAYIVCMSMTDPSAFDAPEISAAIDHYINQRQLPVWLSHGGCKKLVWPDKEMADVISGPGSLTTCPNLKAQSREWLGRYNTMLEPMQDHNTQFGWQFLRN